MSSSMAVLTRFAESPKISSRTVASRVEMCFEGCHPSGFIVVIDGGTTIGCLIILTIIIDDVKEDFVL